MSLFSRNVPSRVLDWTWTVLVVASLLVSPYTFIVVQAKLYLAADDVNHEPLPEEQSTERAPDACNPLLPIDVAKDPSTNPDHAEALSSFVKKHLPKVWEAQDEIRIQQDLDQGQSGLCSDSENKILVPLFALAQGVCRSEASGKVMFSLENVLPGESEKDGAICSALHLDTIISGWVKTFGSPSEVLDPSGESDIIPWAFENRHEFERVVVCFLPNELYARMAAAVAAVRNWHLPEGADGNIPIRIKHMVLGSPGTLTKRRDRKLDDDILVGAQNEFMDKMRKKYGDELFNERVTALRSLVDRSPSLAMEEVMDELGVVPSAVGSDGDDGMFLGKLELSWRYLSNDLMHQVLASVSSVFKGLGENIAGAWSAEAKLLVNRLTGDRGKKKDEAATGTAGGAVESLSAPVGNNANVQCQIPEQESSAPRIDEPVRAGRSSQDLGKACVPKTAAKIERLVALLAHEYKKDPSSDWIVETFKPAQQQTILKIAERVREVHNSKHRYWFPPSQNRKGGGEQTIGVGVGVNVHDMPQKCTADSIDAAINGIERIVHEGEKGSVWNSLLICFLPENDYFFFALRVIVTRKLKLEIEKKERVVETVQPYTATSAPTRLSAQGMVSLSENTKRAWSDFEALLRTALPHEVLMQIYHFFMLDGHHDLGEEERFAADAFHTIFRTRFTWPEHFLENQFLQTETIAAFPVVDLFTLKGMVYRHNWTKGNPWRGNNLDVGTCEPPESLQIRPLPAKENGRRKVEMEFCGVKLAVVLENRPLTKITIEFSETFPKSPYLAEQIQVWLLSEPKVVFETGKEGEKGKSVMDLLLGDGPRPSINLRLVRPTVINSFQRYVMKVFSRRRKTSITVGDRGTRTRPSAGVSAAKLQLELLRFLEEQDERLEGAFLGGPNVGQTLNFVSSLNRMLSNAGVCPLGEKALRFELDVQVEFDPNQVVLNAVSVREEGVV